MKHVGGYELIDELGRGAQGVVYRARNERGDEVAIKLLCEDRGERPDRVARFLAEGARVRELRHPGICAVSEVGEERGHPYIVMELLPGTPLAKELTRLKRGGAREHDTAQLSSGFGRRAREAARLVERLARATQYAHEAGVLHCDIKPENVMLLMDGRPVLLDFGLARVAGERAANGCGTPAYMAPEHLRADLGPPGVRSDVHALGAVLFEVLMLEPAFDAPTRVGVFRQLLVRDVRLPAAARRATPKGLAAVVETALALEPLRRYGSALALAEDLAHVLQGEPITARGLGAPRRVGRWARRHRATFAGVLLCAAGALLVIVALASSVASARSLRDELERYADRGASAELLAREASETWPARPVMSPRMSAWVAEARSLLARRGRHERWLRRATVDRTSSAERTETVAHLGRLARLPVRINGVEARLRAGEALEERTVTRHAAAWDETLAALASPTSRCAYGGLALRPQVGLLPLGRDPTSGLFEFAHVGSGVVPVRAASGRLAVDGDTCIVFVLLPGGVFEMGASGSGESADVDVRRYEVPVHSVALAPFLIAKHELTQGQWLRLTGENPTELQGAWHDLTFTLAHPVHSISWEDAVAGLSRAGLLLPTEAQWEYAARAGTRTPWSSGGTSESLAGFANLADLSFARRTAQAHASPDRLLPSDLTRPALDDGWPCTAPVGTFAPNAFGLHDVHGNVFEHVRDAFGPYTLTPRAGDGLREGGNPSVRIARGGGYMSRPADARSAFRCDSTPGLRWGCGCRPIWPIEP